LPKLKTGNHYPEAFPRKVILFLDKATTGGKRDDPMDGEDRATQDANTELTGVNDRLSTFLTPYESKRAFVQRPHPD
jgi:hypothetical protein